MLMDGCTESESDLLEHVQYEAAEIVTGATKRNSKQRLMQEPGWEDIKVRGAIHKLLLYFKIVNNLCPSDLTELLPFKLVKEQIIFLRTASNYSFFQVVPSAFKDPFSPPPLGCAMTSV